MAGRFSSAYLTRRCELSDLNFTPIYERARAHFSITRDEYALCNYVQTWSAHPDNKMPGWCDRTREQMAKWMGITERGVRKMIDRLVSDGLLDRAEGSKHLRVTRNWFQVVNQAKAEQSSVRDAEQSSGQKRNKVPEKAEQSSGKKRNKVPTHNNTNSKYSNSNSKISPAQKEPNEISELKEEKYPPQVPPQPPPRTGYLFEDWINSLKTDFRITEGFTITQKIPAEYFEEYVTRFRALANTQPEKYVRRHDLTGHFLNWSRVQYQKEKNSGPAATTNGRATINRLGENPDAYNEKQAF